LIKVRFDEAGTGVARVILTDDTEQRPLELAERERAAVDEPVVHADVQAGLEADASAVKAEVDQDADIEI
jgi:hypothetical protein